MQVETYEIEELKGECENLAADSEAVELIKKLGLTGQSELVEPNSETRFPYPMLTIEQHNVFKLVCPVETRLEAFKGGIIPLRVLQVAAFCKEMPQIHHLEVWHPANVRDDPILIGKIREYSSEGFLLARWGEHLKPFDELRKEAARIWASKALVAVRGIAQEMTQAANLDLLMEMFEAGCSRADALHMPKLFYWREN